MLAVFVYMNIQISIINTYIHASLYIIYPINMNISILVHINIGLYYSMHIIYINIYKIMSMPTYILER